MFAVARRRLIPAAARHRILGGRRRVFRPGRGTVAGLESRSTMRGQLGRPALDPLHALHRPRPCRPSSRNAPRPIHPPDRRPEMGDYILRGDAAPPARHSHPRRRIAGRWTFSPKPNRICPTSAGLRWREIAVRAPAAGAGRVPDRPAARWVGRPARHARAGALGWHRVDGGVRRGARAAGQRTSRRRRSRHVTIIDPAPAVRLRRPASAGPTARRGAPSTFGLTEPDLARRPQHLDRAERRRRWVINGGSRSSRTGTDMSLR